MLTLPHLETDITQACQLSCVGCNHLVPLWRKHGPRQANPAQMEHDLGILAKLIHVPRWGALGGEPTLHRGLTELLQVARASGVADRTEVWTNGLLLPKMAPAFWKAFDILILSVYEGQHDEDSLAWIRTKCADEGVILEVKDERIKHNFRTLLEPVPTDAVTTKKKYRECFFRGFSRAANYGFFFTCCCAPHMPLLLRGEPYGTDGIPITADMTENDIRGYLNQEEPLASCAQCAGRATAKPIPWHEERIPLKWLAASAGTV